MAFGVRAWQFIRRIEAASVAYNGPEGLISARYVATCVAVATVISNLSIHRKFLAKQLRAEAAAAA